LAAHFNLLYEMQLQSSDFLFRAANLYPKEETEENIVIVAIDDKSLDELGHFSSWPRSYHAHIIDIITAAGARTIAFDVLFSEPMPDDKQLAASIKQSGKVILPLVGNVTLHKSNVNGEVIVSGTTTRPLKTLEENALTTGHANMLIDEDGVVRRLPLIIPNGEYNEPALALATVAKYLRRSQVIESPVKNNSQTLADREIFLDDTRSMLINYTDDSAAPLNFKAVSYVDVVRENVDPTVFDDKIIIIGVTATGLGDTFWTPMGRMMSGVELHASAMHTILAGNFLKPASPFITIPSILVLAFLCGLAVLRLRTIWATLLVGFIFIVYFLTAFSFFDNGIILNMLYPPLTIVGTFVSVNVYNYTSEQSQRKEITKTFGRYVSSSVVDKILTASEEGELRLGGEEHEVTVMFADARSFTNIAESLQPQELVTVLNRYLDVIIRSVLKYDGIINKFGGDSIMAIWSVPVDCEEHASLAVKAAVEAQHAIRELQEQETTLPKMEFGIGVNTGRAVAGNMGSADRLEYSVIGDTVNTAARLAGLTPGGKVWISAETFDLIKDYIKAIPLEPLKLKGKREKIQAYEVIDIQNGQPDNPESTIY